MPTLPRNPFRPAERHSAHLPVAALRYPGHCRAPGQRGNTLLHSQANRRKRGQPEKTQVMVGQGDGGHCRPGSGAGVHRAGADPGTGETVVHLAGLHPRIFPHFLPQTVSTLERPHDSHRVKRRLPLFSLAHTQIPGVTQGGLVGNPSPSRRNRRALALWAYQ